VQKYERLGWSAKTIGGDGAFKLAKLQELNENRDDKVQFGPFSPKNLDTCPNIGILLRHPAG
jgi:hypothetical protein